MLRLSGSGCQSVQLNFFRYSKLPKPLSHGGRPIAVNKHHIKSNHITYHIIYHIISYRIVSCRVVSRHVTSSHVISYISCIIYHIISYRVMSCHIISYHIISYIQYHIPYHIISYHSYKVTLYKTAITISCSTRLSLSQNKVTTSFKPCMGFQTYFSVTTKQTD